MSELIYTLLILNLCFAGGIILFITYGMFIKKSDNFDTHDSFAAKQIRKVSSGSEKILS